MILPPLNDQRCLGLVIARVREWARSSYARGQARRFGTIAALAEHLRSQPQLDDTGRGRGKLMLPCDYGVRLRENPPNGDCVERSAWYVTIAEILDPATERTLITVGLVQGGQAVRHTNVVERAAGGSWQPVDLLPHVPGIRNASDRETAKEILDVAHPLGKMLLAGFLGSEGSQIADVLGGIEQEGVAQLDNGGTPAPTAPPKSKPSVDVHTARNPAGAPAARPTGAAGLKKGRYGKR